jgi:ABC-2 type transport system permease protein
MKDSSLWLLTTGRFKQFVREPGALFWTFGFPLLLTIVLGLAFRPGKAPKNRIAIVDNVQGKAAALVLCNDERLVCDLRSAAQADDLLSRNEVALVIEKHGDIVYHLDPMRPDAENLRRYIDDHLQRAAGRADAVTTREETTRASGSRYIDWLVPGLLGMQLMSGSMYGVGWTIVENRQKKLLKRLVATPMRRRDFLISHMLARLVAVAVEVVTLLVFARFAFDVDVRGSWIAVSIVAVAGAAAFVGLALLCAARAQNSETVSGLMNVAMFPMFLFSGVFFSSANFPDWAQPAIKALPLSALNDALRAIINQGASLQTQGVNFAIMAVWGVVSFVVALRIFRWT